MFLRVFLLGYVACMMTIAGIGLLAKVFSQTHLVVTTASYHFDRTKDYNERNYGLGLEHQYSDELALSGGVYKNSFYRTTSYAMVAYTPLMYEGWRFGGIGGVMTGYSNSVTPMIMGLVKKEWGDIGINIILVPSVIGLQITYRLP